MLRYSIIFLGVLVFALFPSFYTYAQYEEPTLKMILDTWESKRKTWSSMRYTVRSTCEFMRDGYDMDGTPLPKGNTKRSKNLVALFDFTQLRYRLNLDYEVPSQTQYDRRVSESAFNGKQLQEGLPRDQNSWRSGEDADLVILTGDMNQQQVNLAFYPLFMAHGFVPTERNPINPEVFVKKLDRTEFLIHGNGKIQNTNCVILRTEPIGQASDNVYDEYWIDVNQGCTIRQVSCYVRNQIRMRWDISYKSTAQGWLPDSWNYIFMNRNKPKENEQYRVEKVEIVPISDQDFEIKVKPGMLVEKISYPKPDPKSNLNLTLPSRVKYQITPDGTWKELSSHGFTTKVGTILPPEKSFLAKWWWPFALGLVLIIACYFYLRRKRRFQIANS